MLFKTVWTVFVLNFSFHFFQALSEEYTKVTFAKIEMDGKDELGFKYKIDVFPTFLLYEDGKLVGKVLGANPEKLKKELENLSRDRP